MTHTTDNQTNASERSTVTDAPKKKLIEVSLPLAAINQALKAEKGRKVGKPQQIHHWWARRPITGARAVLFAQLVDDPSAHPEEFPTIEAQAVERDRLHAILEELAQWDAFRDESILATARAEIRRSFAGTMPTVLDPFAGGGAIPMEAQRLGLGTQASDLNPVAALINRALLEVPPTFADMPPVHPAAENRTVPRSRAEGLAEDLRKYGAWVRDEAERRIGRHYPTVKTSDGVDRRVIAWIWARTVRSPNPANPIETPLVSTWWLSSKKGKEAYIVPRVTGASVTYEVVHGPGGPDKGSDGTRVGRGAVSIADGTPISSDYIKAEGVAGRMGAHLMAVVVEGDKGRLYVTPDQVQAAAANVPRPTDVPDEDLPYDPRNIWTPQYGLSRFSDLFTDRQLLALTTFCDLIPDAHEAARRDALDAGLPLGESLVDGGRGAQAYADAIALGLSFAISRLSDWSNSLCRWEKVGQVSQQLFAEQSIKMAWDYSEANVLGGSSGSFAAALAYVAKAWELSYARGPIAEVAQADARYRSYEGVVVSTDPPYYDNINYSDLSDFFYVWLRRSLRDIVPDLVPTLLTPKADELVANPYRHDGAEGAAEYFVDGFNKVFAQIRHKASRDAPLTVYYAYKQQDSDKTGTSSTGWETLLHGLIDNGWEITATWPLHTEGATRMIAQGANALATSIVLACRPRSQRAESTTRRAFISSLRSELPDALRVLMQGAIAPVDLDQAAYGPGIAVYSRYSRVRDADGSAMSVRQALSLITEITDEVRGEGIADMDADTRFAVKWYRQFGWSPEVSGTAITMAQSVGTSLGRLERGGIFEAKGGKARLFSPTQLEGEWDPISDEHISVWEATVRLAAVMAKDGADKVAELLPSVQTRVNLDAVKELGFLLFHEAEKKKDTKDAILFNGLVSAWGDVNEQARKFASTPRSTQQEFDFDEDED
ncbi:DUF1156 domain-containing protein [Micrococcus luteus]|uniref:DUF1156 domain-containing protein n=1 Tax=Micrococcus luteus TaxID=1270 RepID=UPI00254B4126|nr:DUF1156 domain-containing protein [Micrococcus luteus]MDK8178781.1 DUF1156 domain-containing protein [Micrococcus luteus]